VAEWVRSSWRATLFSICKPHIVVRASQKTRHEELRLPESPYEAERTRRISGALGGSGPNSHSQVMSTTVPTAGASRISNEQSLAFIGSDSARNDRVGAGAGAESLSITRLEGSRWRGGRLWSWNRDRQVCVSANRED
jgi:hypothetical protein